MKKYLRWLIPACVFMAAATAVLMYMFVHSAQMRTDAAAVRMLTAVMAALYLACIVFLVLLVVQSMRGRATAWKIVSWILLADAIAGVFMFAFILLSTVLGRVVL